MAKRCIKGNKSAVKEAVKLLLANLGCDMTDRNFVDTPKRVAELLWRETHQSPPPLRNFFEQEDELILIRDHLTFSRCPHHLERVKLKVTFAYIPNQIIVGLSKIPRMIDYLVSGFTLQEAMAPKIVDYFMKKLNPRGAACYIIGSHNCMQTRGVRSPAVTETNALRGVFLEDAKTREEFMAMAMKGGL